MISKRPVAYMHTMYYEKGCGKSEPRFTTDPDELPFGYPGEDHSPEYKVKVVPLFKEIKKKTVN